jgi:hypothetical protein
MAAIRQFKYEGEDPRFEDGEFYTYREISNITGIVYNTLKNRIYKYDIVTNDLIYRLNNKEKEKVVRKPNRDTVWPRLETKADVLSQKYLSKPLRTKTVQPCYGL